MGGIRFVEAKQSSIHIYIWNEITHPTERKVRNGKTQIGLVLLNECNQRRRGSSFSQQQAGYTEFRFHRHEDTYLQPVVNSIW